MNARDALEASWGETMKVAGSPSFLSVTANHLAEIVNEVIQLTGTHTKPKSFAQSGKAYAKASILVDHQFWLDLAVMFEAKNGDLWVTIDGGQKGDHRIPMAKWMNYPTSRIARHITGWMEDSVG
jgi:hypothetical protein